MDDFSEIYNPPRSLPIVALAQLLMRQERWSWDRALGEAMERRERAYTRRIAERVKRRRRGR